MERLLAIGTIGLLLVGIANTDFLSARIAEILAADLSGASAALAIAGVACMGIGVALAAMWARQQSERRFES